MAGPAGGQAAFKHLQTLLQSALNLAFPGCGIEKIPLKTGWQNGQGIFSSSLPFLCSQKEGISPLEASEKLRACLPKEDRLFVLSEKAGGYLNFFPSPAWYAGCFFDLSQSASFSSWHATEEDFGFFARSSSAAAQIQRIFVRLCSVLRNCLAEGIPLDPLAGSPALLCRPEELSLLFALFRLSLAGAEGLLPVLREAANAFDRFYSTWRIWSPDAALARTRVGLCFICGAGMEQGMRAAGILF